MINFLIKYFGQKYAQKVMMALFRGLGWCGKIMGDVTPERCRKFGKALLENEQRVLNALTKSQLKHQRATNFISYLKQKHKNDISKFAETNVGLAETQKDLAFKNQYLQRQYHFLARVAVAKEQQIGKLKDDIKRLESRINELQTTIKLSREKRLEGSPNGQTK